MSLSLQGALIDANIEIIYNDTATTCLELGIRFVADVIKEGSDKCAEAREILFEPCCYAPPSEPCVLCQMGGGRQGDVKEDTSVSFYGSSTTCSDLNSFLVSREEHVGFMCQTAKAEVQESCCYQQCTVCGDGSLYWDNPTKFNDITFACGELGWILSGNNVEQNSDDCNKMQQAYYDDCCSGPSELIPDAGTKCNLCDTTGKDWYAQVEYEDKAMTCLELDSKLLQKGGESKEMFCFYEDNFLTNYNLVFDNSAECDHAKADFSNVVSARFLSSSLRCLMCQLHFVKSAVTSHPNDRVSSVSMDRPRTVFLTLQSLSMGSRQIALVFTTIYLLEWRPTMTRALSRETTYSTLAAMISAVSARVISSIKRGW